MNLRVNQPVSNSPLHALLYTLDGIIVLEIYERVTNCFIIRRLCVCVCVCVVREKKTERKSVGLISISQAGQTLR